MNWNHWIRQFHRWVAVIFTLSGIGVIIALQQEKPAAWASYIPLLPLALLLITDLYLFVLPYVVKRRGVREGGSSDHKES